MGGMGSYREGRNSGGKELGGIWNVKKEGGGKVERRDRGRKG